MPISESEFERGDLPKGPPILFFLRRGGDQAYTVEEIVEGLKADASPITNEVVEAVLSNLVDARVVEGKMVGGRAHYHATYDSGAGRAGG